MKLTIRYGYTKRFYVTDEYPTYWYNDESEVMILEGDEELEITATLPGGQTITHYLVEKGYVKTPWKEQK